MTCKFKMAGKKPLGLNKNPDDLQLLANRPGF